jgi:hypothetical protein
VFEVGSPLKAEAERVQASVCEIESLADARRGPTVPALQQLPGFRPHGRRRAAQRDAWSATSLEILHGPLDNHERTPVSMAFAGSAKRGHSFSFPGPGNPTTFNSLPDNHIFLPDNHIVVLGKTTSSQITKASS